MMRISTILGERLECGALITGSVGQVASQTLPAISCTDAAAGMPVLRPLIGMDKDKYCCFKKNRHFRYFHTAV